MKPNKQAIAQVVRDYIRDRHPGGITLEVVEQGVRHEDYWWYVPIRPSKEPQKRYEFYETLADVENELEENEHLKVLLVPAGSD